MDQFGRQNDTVDELAKAYVKDCIKKNVNTNLLDFSTNIFHSGLMESNNQMSAKESCMNVFDVKVFSNTGMNTTIFQFQARKIQIGNLRDWQSTDFLLDSKNCLLSSQQAASATDTSSTNEAMCQPNVQIALIPLRNLLMFFFATVQKLNTTSIRI